MNKGQIIVIEGACDGIGKTTQVEMLSEFFSKTGVRHITHHFPTYGTIQGKLATEYLKGNLGEIKGLNPYFINSLYAMDRAYTWHNELKQSYESGYTILLDRYTTSSLIYQTALIENIEEKKNFINYILEFEYNKLGIKEPDKIIFLEAPFEIAAEKIKNRIQNAGIKNDIHERDIEFMKKVYETAMFVSDYLSWDKINCYQDNKMKNLQDIHFEIQDLVRKRK